MVLFFEITKNQITGDKYRSFRLLLGEGDIGMADLFLGKRLFNDLLPLTGHGLRHKLCV
jgi:hypothetical protein